MPRLDVFQSLWAMDPGISEVYWCFADAHEFLASAVAVDTLI